MKRYAEEVAALRTGVTVQIRVGLNSGEVVVRAIGSDLRMDYTAVGQTTHLAARMEQLADPGAILLTPGPSGSPRGTSRSSRSVRCRSRASPSPSRSTSSPERAPIRITTPGGARPVASPASSAATPRSTQLRQALEHAGAGHGQVVAVVGEPGVGKSRLYWEFTHSHRPRAG